MRLKEDRSNWNASNVARKLKEAPVNFRYKSKKNTNRWCKGKVGVEHQYETVDKKVVSVGNTHWFWKVQKCAHCNREMLKDMTTEKI